MKLKSLALTPLFIAVILVAFTSCKNCKIKDDHTESGLIAKEAIVYAPSGNLTNSMSGNYHIFAGGPYSSDNWQVSFDGGVTKQAIDFSVYSVLGCPTTINCSAKFTRSVVQEVTGEYTYTVHAETCKSCDMKTYVENYVLVAALPGSAVINYVPQIEEQ